MSEVNPGSDSNSRLPVFCVRRWTRFWLYLLISCNLSPKLEQVLTLTGNFLLSVSKDGPGSCSISRFPANCVRRRRLPRFAWSSSSSFGLIKKSAQIHSAHQLPALHQPYLFLPSILKRIWSSFSSIRFNLSFLLLKIKKRMTGIPGMVNKKAKAKSWNKISPAFNPARANVNNFMMVPLSGVTWLGCITVWGILLEQKQPKYWSRKRNLCPLTCSWSLKISLSLK